MTHICVSKLTIIGSDNGLSPSRRQAIIWTNAGILLIGPLGTNFSGSLIEILTFSFKKMRLKVSSAKRRPSCLGLNVLRLWFVNCLVRNHYLDQCWVIVELGTNFHAVWIKIQKFFMKMHLKVAASTVYELVGQGNKAADLETIFSNTPTYCPIWQCHNECT